VLGRISLDQTDLIGEELGLDDETARRIDRVALLACGTSFHASLVGRMWIEQLGRVAAHAELASEVRYRDPVFTSAIS